MNAPGAAGRRPLRRRGARHRRRERGAPRLTRRGRPVDGRPSVDAELDRFARRYARRYGHAPEKLAAPLVLPIGAAITREVLNPDGARVIAVNSGIGAGKSTAIAQAAFAVAMLRPGSAQLVSAGTYGLLMAVLKPRFDAVIGNAAVWSGGATRPHYRFPNGSIIDFVNYRLASNQDEASNPWEGRDYCGLWVDEVEQLPPTVFDHSFQRTRLKSRDASGRWHEPFVVWVGRPGAVYHWMEKAEELRQAGRRVASLVFPSRSNWTLAESYFANMRASMSLAEYQCVTQEVIGARMPVSGAIYRAFDATDGDAMHADPVRGTLTGAAPGNLLAWDPTPHKAYPTFAAVDFGVTTSAVLFLQEWLVNGSPASVVVDEWCPDDPTSTRDLVAGIRARGWSLAEAICDPAGEARQRAAGLTSEVSIMRRDTEADPDGLGGGLGIPVCATVPPIRRGVRDGILRVDARIAAADGTRTLYVVSRLWNHPEGRRGVRHSILGYPWDPRTGEPKKGKAADDTDHVADALRLYIIRRAWGGPPALITAAATRAPAPAVRTRPMRAAALRQR